MSTVFVPTSLFKVPMLCVACAEPTVMPANPAARKASSIEASASWRSGNTTTTEKVSFLLCPGCVAARAEQKYRQSHYPGRWWTRGVGLFAAASFFGWLRLYDSPTLSNFGADLFVVFVVATIAAVTTSGVLRMRYDRDRPMSEDGRNRLAMIEGALTVSPPTMAHPTGAALTFKNETFAQVFAAANGSAPVPSIKVP
jgi:hypothetical protein